MSPHPTSRSTVGFRLTLAPALLIVGALALTRARAGEPDVPPPGAPSPGDVDASRPGPDPSDAQAPTSVADPSADAPSDDSDRPYWRQNLFRRFLTDQKYLFTTWWPYEFRRPGFTAPLVAGTALAYSSSRDEGESPDLQFERRFSEWTSDRNATAFHAVSNLGDGAVGAVLIGSTYLIGRWSGHDKLAEASSLSAGALLDVGLYSIVLKEISARTRPGGGGQGNFLDYHAAPGLSADSFPSGHAMDAFAIANVFAGVYRDHRWVPWVAYGAASLVGVSRVALGRHFPSDVFVGGLLGNSFGRMVLARQGDSERPATRFEPFTDPANHQAGVLWTRTW
jgi:hypothetical protein